MGGTRDEVFDWSTSWLDEPAGGGEIERRQAQPVEPRRQGSVNPVNGHARDCMCPRCPGWYENRAELAAKSIAAQQPARRSSVLFDQVIPVCVLMAMVTVCGLVLLPVIVPLMAISAVLIVAVAVVVMAGAVAVIYAVNAVKIGARDTVRGEVVRRRWR